MQTADDDLPSLAESKSPEASSPRFLIDPRSAGVFRISLGLLLLLHAWFHLRWSQDLYSPSGILPSHLLPHSQEIPYFPSLLTELESSDWGIPAFAAVAVMSYTCLLFGWHSRFATCLSLIAFSTIAHRNPYLVIGADEILGSVLLWSCLLPLGDRFSLDRWLARRASTIATSSASNTALAGFGVLLQLSILYLATAWLKSGPTWWSEGLALERVLGMLEFRRPGAAVLEQLPPWCLSLLTRSTLLLEYLLPALILSPWQLAWTRRIAIGGMISLHTGILLVLDTGLFSVTMIALTPLLVSHEDWRRIEGWKGLRLIPPPPALAASGVMSSPDGLLKFRRPLVNSLAVFLLLGMLQENAVRTDLLPEHARPLPVLGWPWRFAAAAQRWTMFAPDPPAFDPRVTVQVRGLDGTFTALWDSSTRGDPRHDFLWKVFMRRSSLPARANREGEINELRQQVCRFFANDYLTKHPERMGHPAFIEIEVTYCPTIRLNRSAPPEQERVAFYHLDSFANP